MSLNDEKYHLNLARAELLGQEGDHEGHWHTSDQLQGMKGMKQPHSRK